MSFSKVDFLIGAGLFPKGVLLYDDPSSGFCVTLVSGAAYTMMIDIKKHMAHITQDESIIQESMNRVFETMLGERFDALITKDDDSNYGVACKAYAPIDPVIERLFWIDVCHRLLYHPSLSAFRDESKVSYTSLDVRAMMDMIHEQSSTMFVQPSTSIQPETLSRLSQPNQGV